MATIEPGPVVVPDNDVESDQDSTIGNDTASSTDSVTSSVLNYRQENGRTYHGFKDGKYNLPNDSRECDRLDLQHALFLRTFGNRLGMAPPCDDGSNVKRVLDIGTGTGIWAVDYGDEHPESEVLGVDLSPSQPDFVPPNVQFVVDDIDDEWTHSAPFDYIHSRMMNFSVSDWKEYLRKIYDNLTPGGYVEVQEIGVMAKSDDGTLTSDHTLFKWLKLLNEASIKLGRPYLPLDNLKTLMAEAGFEAVVEAGFKWPTNQWPKEKKYKELGIWHRENMSGAVEALTLAPFTRAHGWTQEEVNVFLLDVRKDLNDTKIHAYWPIYSVFARKPEKA